LSRQYDYEKFHLKKDGNDICQLDQFLEASMNLFLEILWPVELHLLGFVAQIVYTQQLLKLLEYLLFDIQLTIRKFHIHFVMLDFLLHL